MSKFIKLKDGIDGVSDLIINIDLITAAIPKYNSDCSPVWFLGDQNVLVKETPERILKMIDTAK